MDLLFSVIIPTYNAQDFVGEAIESALAQRNVKKEIILVDDGSTDKTFEVVKGFGNHVRIFNQNNSGPSSARNNGVRGSRGNVVAFLDSDDIWLPEKLYVQKEKLLDGYELVYTNRVNIDATGGVLPGQSFAVPSQDKVLWKDLLVDNMITTSSVAIYKDTFNRLGGFRDDIRFCEDWDLWLRFAENHNIGYSPEQLVKYRIHEAGVSRNYKSMNNMRIKVVTTALSSGKGVTLSNIQKRKILAKSWAACAWDSAKEKDLGNSLKNYWHAMLKWPLDRAIWYDVARALFGRI